MRHVGENLHAIAAARRLQRIAHPAHVIERNGVVALRVDEKRRRVQLAQHVAHRARLQRGSFPVPLLRGAVEHDAGSEVAAAAADHDRIASALAHAHDGDLRRARLHEIDRAVNDGGHLIIRQCDTHFAALERLSVALPAGEEVGRERHVAVGGKALREVERVLH